MHGVDAGLRRRVVEGDQGQHNGAVVFVRGSRYEVYEGNDRIAEGDVGCVPDKCNLHGRKDKSVGNRLRAIGVNIRLEGEQYRYASRKTEVRLHWDNCPNEWFAPYNAGERLV